MIFEYNFSASDGSKFIESTEMSTDDLLKYTVETPAKMEGDKIISAMKLGTKEGFFRIPGPGDRTEYKDKVWTVIAHEIKSFKPDDNPDELKHHEDLIVFIHCEELQ